MTAWTDLVKKIWEENKKKPGFKFKDALILAKKQYKGKATKKGGVCPLSKGGEGEEMENPPMENPPMEGTGGEKTEMGGEMEEKGGKMDVKPEEMGGKKKLFGFLGGKKGSKKSSKKDKKRKNKSVKKGGNEIKSTGNGTPYFSSQ